MVKIAWKVINGYGPYAYLQESVKEGGKVTSKHIAYLGAAGKNGLIPGKIFTVPPSEDFDGARMMVPFVGEETVDALKPGPLAAIQSMKTQVAAGAAKKDIVLPGKGKTASTKAAAVAPKKKGKAGSGKGKAEVAPHTGETATAGHQAPAVSPGQAAAPKASAAPKVPLADDGKPIVSAAHAKSLEKAAAMGDPKALVAAMHEAAGKVKKHHKQTMIYSAASDLFAQMQATESTESLSEGAAADAGDFQLNILPKVKDQHLLSEQWTKLLEDAAATGDATALAHEVNELKASTWAPGSSTKNLHDAITVAHSQLKEQIDDAILANAVATGKAKVVSAAKDGSTKEPLITKAEIQQIEAAAETGDAELVKVTSDLLAAKYAATDYKKLQAIVAAGKSGADQVKAIEEGAPGGLDVVPPAPEKGTNAKKGKGKVAPDNQATAPDTLPDTLDAQGVVKEKPTLYPKMIGWAHGKPLVAPDDVEKLEAAATTGDVGALEQAMTKLVSPTQTAEKNAAIMNAGVFLSHQMADPQVQQVHKGLYGPAKVAPNNQGAAVGQQAGVAAPDWKLVEGPKGSTPGGLYEDQGGNKFYIKAPKSQQHVRNELLAQDLYKLAGVDLLRSEETELDGAPAIASEWVENMTGSGINPKDLPGTREGFVADAWLANWDSVGVGSTKYDNILNQDGKAVRVDVGGALLFRGTGGPKGHKFGAVVTEIEGLRDPTLNPVAATVYGDMTPLEIKASAHGVLAISETAIEQAVEARFPDDPELAEELTQKLISRRNYISQWVYENTQGPQVDAGAEATAPVAPNTSQGQVLAASVQEPAPAAPAPGQLPKAASIPTNYYGQSFISTTNVKKMEKAAALGNIKLLAETMAEAGGKGYKLEKKRAAAEVAASLLEQMFAISKASVPASQDALHEPPPLQVKAKIHNVPNYNGAPILSQDQVKGIEAVAAGGDLDSVNDALQALKPEKSSYEWSYQSGKISQELGAQIGVAKQLAANAYALSIGKPKVIHIPLDAEGEPNIPGNETSMLEDVAATGDEGLFQSAANIVGAKYNQYHGNNYAKNQAFGTIRNDLKGQMQALAAANQDPVAPSAIGVPTAGSTTADGKKWIPTDKFGTPMLSAPNIKKLEKAAESGQVKTLSSAMIEAADKIKAKPKKHAVYKAGVALLQQMQGDVEAPESEEGPAKSLRPTGLQPKVTTAPRNSSDKVLTDSEIQLLEAAAATGDQAKLTQTAQDLGKQTYSWEKEKALNTVYQNLFGQIEAAALEAAVAQAVATGKPKIGLVENDNKGEPVLSQQHIKQLEAVAAAGDSGFLQASAQLLEEQYPTAYGKQVLAKAQDSLQKQMAAIAGSDTKDGQPDGQPAAVGAGGLTGLGEIKVTVVPQDNKGKPLITATNVEKLEKAAAAGIEELEQLIDALAAKMASPAKKAAIHNAAAELKGQLLGATVQEGDGGSGFGYAMTDVGSGKVLLPDQEVPSPAKVKKHRNEVKQGKKNYDGALEKISGKKGSNEGGLFKDKDIGTLHYIKWPNSEARTKMEALTALLYSYAEIPVPSVRVIEFQDKDAIMSDWIDEAGPMTPAKMKQHADVRAGFAVDAWLANWDVVGLTADNIVSGPGNKAYRIDVGGSLIFRAQGKGKPFPAEVKEIESMRNSSINKEAAQVFDNLSSPELAASVQRVVNITDDQIDDAVDSVDLPETSPDYPASQFGPAADDLPKLLKTRLKQRRDYLAETVLKQAKKKEARLNELKDISDLSDHSVEVIADSADDYKLNSPSTTQKWQLTEKLMVNELGEDTGKKAAEMVKDHYNGWKGWSVSPQGSMLRWGAGQLHGQGDAELRRLDRYNQFLVKEGTLSEQKRKEYADYLQGAVLGDNAKPLVQGLGITREQNEVMLAVKHPGKQEITIYRGWKPDQVKYLDLKDAPVGSVVQLDDPPLYSWSFAPKVAHSFEGGHGSFVARAKVPVDTIILTDLSQTTGSHTGEDEVLFKGVDNFEMEIIKKS